MTRQNYRLACRKWRVVRRGWNDESTNELEAQARLKIRQTPVEALAWLIASRPDYNLPNPVYTNSSN